MKMRRTNSASAMNPYSNFPTSSGAASLMPHRKPDFSEGSILEERDSRSQRSVARYRVGPLLGQGGFAKCYDVKDLETGEHLALKVCERQKLIQTKTLGKLQTEIAIHRRMSHKNIVKFHRTFQDEWNIYILLELCRGTTLMDLSKQRKRFTPQETQHIMIQTLMACQYMHTNNVIHRDLKLGNMMMDENMNVKIGDFGLAAELLYDGERKRTICGTPNYIAPEILAAGRDGHSFEVDTWSVGVILYTLLVGEPPFQTSDVKRTYQRIKCCSYDFPLGCDVPEVAKQLIHRILQSNPTNRPTLMDIRNHPFFTNAPTAAPMSLYPSRLRAEKEARMARERASSTASSGPSKDDALQKPPTASAVASQQVPLSGREALRPIYNGVAGNFGPSSNTNNKDATGAAPTSSRFSAPTTNTASNQQQQDAPKPYSSSSAPVPLARRPSTSSDRAPSSSRADSNNNDQQQQVPPPPVTAREGGANNFKMDREERNYFAAAHEELHRTLIVDNENNAAQQQTQAHAQPQTPPCAAPAIWVTDYADFSNRYGLAYRLSSGHTGCHFNDNTKLVWEHVTNRAEYITRERQTVAGQPVMADKCEPMVMGEQADTKKTTLIRYFKSYINAGGKKDSAEVVRCSPVPKSAIPARELSEPNMTRDMIYVKRWMITPQAMVFRLSNRVIQVCFFSDKSEVILASESRIVTFTSRSGNRRTMPLTAVNAEGGELADKLMLTKNILSRLIENRDI